MSQGKLDSPIAPSGSKGSVPLENLADLQVFVDKPVVTSQPRNMAKRKLDAIKNRNFYSPSTHHCSVHDTMSPISCACDMATFPKYAEALELDEDVASPSDSDSKHDRGRDSKSDEHQHTLTNGNSPEGAASKKARTNSNAESRKNGANGSSHSGSKSLVELELPASAGSTDTKAEREHRSETKSAASMDSEGEEKKQNALAVWPQLTNLLKGKRLAIFLDYDGTLTPIVSNPADAIISDKMRQIVDKLSRQYDTAIVTGRGIRTIVDFMKLDTLYYAGSHGFDIRSPGNVAVKQVAGVYVPALKAFYNDISQRVKDIPGALVEDNMYSISVHYRNVSKQETVGEMEKMVDEALTQHSSQLCKRNGKKVWEIRPQFDWDKGKAVLWLLRKVFSTKEGDDRPVVPIYLGDDVTDEDAFRALNTLGQAYGIFVRNPAKHRSTAAQYVLDSTSEVQEFLSRLCGLSPTRTSTNSNANTHHTNGNGKESHKASSSSSS